MPGDFPGAPVVKNLPCNAGDGSFIPGRGTKIPHAVEQLRPHAITRESVLHRRIGMMQRRSCVLQRRPYINKNLKSNACH